MILDDSDDDWNCLMMIWLIKQSSNRIAFVLFCSLISKNKTVYCRDHALTGLRNKFQTIVMNECLFETKVDLDNDFDITRNLSLKFMVSYNAILVMTSRHKKVLQTRKVHVAHAFQEFVLVIILWQPNYWISSEFQEISRIFLVNLVSSIRQETWLKPLDESPS